jgi:hypothetical protein
VSSRQTIVAAALVVGSAAMLLAQSPLATAAHLKCVFQTASAGSWTPSGEGVSKVKRTSLTLEYTDIDTNTGTAESVGLANSRLFINARFIYGNLHLLAMSDSGPLYVTTVFSKQSRPGWYRAVHTRPEYTDVAVLGYTSQPEQYIGECQILN